MIFLLCHYKKSYQLWRYLWRKKSKIVTENKRLWWNLWRKFIRQNFIGHKYNCDVFVVELPPLKIICGGQNSITKNYDENRDRKTWFVTDFVMESFVKTFRVNFWDSSVGEYLMGSFWHNPSQIVIELHHKCRSKSAFWTSLSQKTRQSQESLLIAMENCDGFHHKFNISTEFRQKVHQKVR